MFHSFTADGFIYEVIAIEIPPDMHICGMRMQIVVNTRCGEVERKWNAVSSARIFMEIPIYKSELFCIERTHRDASFPDPDAATILFESVSTWNDKLVQNLLSSCFAPRIMWTNLKIAADFIQMMKWIIK